MKRTSPYVLPIVLIVAGAGLLVMAAFRPQYNDPNWQDQLFGPQWVGRYSPADADAWFALRSKLLTAREGEQDLAVAITGLGLGAAGVLFSVRARSWADLGSLQTPSTRRHFRWLAILVWLSFVPSAWLFYIYTSVRDDYPPMGDIIMIPCAGVAVFGMVGLPVVVLGVNLATMSRSLPVPLWTRPIVRWQNPISWAVWLALVAACTLLLMGVVQMPTIVPSAIATIYLLLCGRATSALPASS